MRQPLSSFRLRSYSPRPFPAAFTLRCLSVEKGSLCPLRHSLYSVDYITVFKACVYLFCSFVGPHRAYEAGRPLSRVEGSSTHARKPPGHSPTMSPQWGVRQQRKWQVNVNEKTGRFPPDPLPFPGRSGARLHLLGGSGSSCFVKGVFTFSFNTQVLSVRGNCIPRHMVAHHRFHPAYTQQAEAVDVISNASACFLVNPAAGKLRCCLSCCHGQSRA